MTTLVGIDEVGLGALAGPAVVAAVEIEDGVVLGVKDSKKIHNRLRMRELARQIKKKSRWAIFEASAQEINEHGIKACWRKLVRLACIQFQHSDDIWIDGSRDAQVESRLSDGLGICIHFLIRGDQKMYQISAASIVAKAYRDALMTKLHRMYSEYEWSKNVGYGTPDHISSIRQFGLSPQHRTLFCRNISCDLLS